MPTRSTDPVVMLAVQDCRDSLAHTLQRHREYWSGLLPPDDMVRAVQRAVLRELAGDDRHEEA